MASIRNRAIWDCVQFGSCPFGIADLWDCVNSGSDPFGIMSIRAIVRIPLGRTKQFLCEADHRKCDAVKSFKREECEKRSFIFLAAILWAICSKMETLVLTTVWDKIAYLAKYQK